MLSSWGFKHRVLCCVFMKRQLDQLSVEEKQAGRQALFAFLRDLLQPFRLHFGLQVDQPHVCKTFTFRGPCKVIRQINGFCDTWEVLSVKRCLGSNQNSQFQVREWRESSTTLRFTHLLSSLGSWYSKGIAKTCQQHCAHVPVYTLNLHCFHTRATA